MLIFWPISSLADAYKRYLSDAYKEKNMYNYIGQNGPKMTENGHILPKNDPYDLNF